MRSIKSTFTTDLQGTCTSNYMTGKVEYISREFQGAEAIDVPVNRWFYIEALYRSRDDTTGQVKVWQDGTLLWDVQNVRTKYPDGATEWSVNNYTSGLGPQLAYFFIDNAEIRTP